MSIDALRGASRKVAFDVSPNDEPIPKRWHNRTYKSEKKLLILKNGFDSRSLIYVRYWHYEERCLYILQFD